jgi:predicted DNA-binding protein
MPNSIKPKLTALKAIKLTREMFDDVTKISDLLGLTESQFIRNAIEAHLRRNSTKTGQTKCTG